MAELWHGWTFRDGLLYAPEWRRGLTQGEIRALPYLQALIADYQRQSRDNDREVREAQDALCQAEARSRFYRSQLILESRYGLMLARISEQS